MINVGYFWVFDCGSCMLNKFAMVCEQIIVIIDIVNTFHFFFSVNEKVLSDIEKKCSIDFTYVNVYCSVHIGYINIFFKVSFILVVFYH